jgi:DNA-binding LytR/AlgR family response regulator
LNTKLKCLLLDDELPGLTYLKMLCEQIPELEVVKAFNNPEIFLSEIPKLDFDICILDIEMPGINGLQIANLIQNKPVIFTTAYKEYAADAFDLNAVDYVRKPIKKERLEQAVQKALNQIRNKKIPKNFIRLNTDKGKAVILFDQILYLYTSPVDSRDKVILLENGTSLTAKNYTFSDLFKELPAMEFCQVNKREAISIKAVAYFSSDEITTRIKHSSGKPLSLTLSDSYRDEFMKKVMR